MRDLYAPFNRNHDRIMFMDLRSAELTKYAANCMLATKISFINQIAELAEHLGPTSSRCAWASAPTRASATTSSTRAAVMAARVSPGHARTDPQRRAGPLLQRPLQAVEAINERQKHKLFERINAFYQGDLKGKTFALWGLAFKPNTDDMRDAPAGCYWSRCGPPAPMCAPSTRKPCRKPSACTPTSRS